MKRFLMILGFIFAINFVVFPQQKPVCDNTTNFLIDKEMPGVYLTFERFGKVTGNISDKSKTPEKGDDIYLRLHNNNCWDIKLRTSNLHQSRGLIINDKGKVAFGEDGVLANIQYDIEEQNGIKVPYRNSLTNFSFLSSGKSILFGVLKEHLSNNRSIYVDFNYGWEDKIFSNNLAPEHRAFFWGYRLEEEKQKKTKQ